MKVLKEKFFASVQMLASHIGNEDAGRSAVVTLADSESGRYIDLVAAYDIYAFVPKLPNEIGNTFGRITVNLYQLFVALEQCEDEIDISITSEGRLCVRSYEDCRNEGEYDVTFEFPPLAGTALIEKDITVGSLRLEPVHFTAILKEMYNFPTTTGGVWFKSGPEGTYLLTSERGIDIHLEIRNLNQIKLEFGEIFIPFRFLNMAYSIMGGAIMGAVEIRIGSRTLSVVTENYELRVERDADMQYPIVDFPVPEELAVFDSMSFALELEVLRAVHKADHSTVYTMVGNSEADVVSLMGDGQDPDLAVHSRCRLGGSVDEDFSMQFDADIMLEITKNPGQDVPYFKVGRVGDSFAIYYKSAIFLKKIIYNHEKWIAK